MIAHPPTIPVPDPLLLQHTYHLSNTMSTYTNVNVIVSTQNIRLHTVNNSILPPSHHHPLLLESTATTTVNNNIGDRDGSRPRLVVPDPSRAVEVQGPKNHRHPHHHNSHPLLLPLQHLPLPIQLLRLTSRTQTRLRQLLLHAAYHPS